MKSLNTLAENIQVKWIRIGFNSQTQQTDWVATINNQNFEFHTGILSCVSKENLVLLERRFRNTNEEGIFRAIRSGGNLLKPFGPAVMKVFNQISEKSQPTSFDLIYSLKIDSEADGQSFDEWCSNFGYNNDSIKALETYRACLINASQLKDALGPDLFREIMSAEEE